MRPLDLLTLNSQPDPAAAAAAAPTVVGLGNYCWCICGASFRVEIDYWITIYSVQLFISYISTLISVTDPIL